MKDPKAEFEKAVASLINGKRGLGTAPPDEASRFTGTCLRALGILFAEAARMKTVDVLADVLAWHLAMIGTASGPAGIASVVGLLEWHACRMADSDTEKGGREPDGTPEPSSH